MRIVVTGSLAYDYLMTFPGHFKDHILPDKVHTLAVSFLVDSMRRMRGGVAGNIAYSLALLGERPLVVATAGADFGEYRAWMEAVGIDTSGVVEIPDEFTASCFINTDRANNQIVAFYSGAMSRAKDLSLATRGLTKDDLVIISPTDPMAIARYAGECQKLGVPYIFDPGKQTPRLEAEQILTGLAGASVLIGNDYEFGMMAQKLGRTEGDLFASAPVTVVTQGERGSTIFSRGRTIEIPAAIPKEVRDPTGAGDAYLAGLAFGIRRALPLEVAGRVASLVAAYAIEQRGCQEHRFTLPGLEERFRTVFGPSRELQALAGKALTG
ncbi:MAG: carbohydrate kinase family protein [Myxococcales bacterium]|nr:carbohydrate kinase family protein [Myxococcales bacterium]